MGPRPSWDSESLHTTAPVKASALGMPQVGCGTIKPRVVPGTFQDFAVEISA